MDKADELVALGAARHREGRLAEAESLYRRCLRLRPQHPDALNLLGLLLRQTGRLEEGLALSARAAALLPAAWAVQANYAAALAEAGRLDQAIPLMQRVLAANPEDAMTWRNLGQALVAAGRPDAAIAPLETATRLAPEAPEAWLMLAHARAELGRGEAAREAAMRALGLSRRQPALAEQASFLLAALGAAPPPERAPPAYLRALFDRFAPRFDADLQGALGYRTPALLAEALQASGAPAGGAVCDLGCGTGLSGVALRPMAGRLEGVDLSPRMLEQARARGIYDALHEADLLAFLPRRRAAFDVIAAADVLNYLGELAPALAAMRRALRPGGRAGFSIEAALPGETDRPFRLGEGLRYRHQPRYVAELAKGAGFTVLAEQPCILRQEKGSPVAGVLFVLGT
ncbi:MAG: tetratricopeptide repeat protein [Rhodovarius sp.]|nr:tetratricopeptide repeat protein [Rhodovarius sp.]MDW8315124.1 tetratricopeptide repeat protein [Rhodovarius sp.]